MLFDLANIHIEEGKKPGVTFSIELRRNSKIFTVISWFTGDEMAVWVERDQNLKKKTIVNYF